jgi:hypothetical protein
MVMSVSSDLTRGQQFTKRTISWRLSNWFTKMLIERNDTKIRKTNEQTVKMKHKSQTDRQKESENRYDPIKQRQFRFAIDLFFEHVHVHSTRLSEVKVLSK